MNGRLNVTDKFAAILSWILVVIWMAVIFYFSSQPAPVSNDLSQNVTKVIVKGVSNIYDIEVNCAYEYVHNLNHIVRKLGHFTEYFVLALLVMNAFRQSGVEKFKLCIYSLFLCVLYAISDEFHQLFVPGRAGQVKDVFIDSLGAILGIFIYWIYTQS